MGGTTIVISPLKALIADQVSACIEKGIDVAYLSSSLSEGKKTDLFERLSQRSLRAPKSKKSAAGINPATQSPITLLYCTPEQVRGERFRDALRELYGKKRLTGFAIDEGRFCIIQQPLK
jgi:ATP-dependent DNA helicase RecQ